MSDHYQEILEEMRRGHDEVVAQVNREYEEIRATIAREREETRAELRRQHGETLATITGERDTWNERMDRRDQDAEDQRRFLGELNRRGEIVLRDVLRANAAMRREIRESIDERRRESNAIVRQLEKNTARTDAHTRAIFALIDRLEGGGFAPAG